MREIKKWVEAILGEGLLNNKVNGIRLYLLGVKGRGKNKYIVNFILNVARYAIWCRRNVMKGKQGNINLWVFFPKEAGRASTYACMNIQLDWT